MHPRTVAIIFRTLLTGALLFSSATVLAQDQAPAEQNNDEAAREQAAPEMQEMAQAMESMADMCRMMMEREMRYMPYWVAAGAVIGALLTAALVLFVVLEIQWIRFFGLRIKAEKRNLG